MRLRLANACLTALLALGLTGCIETGNAEQTSLTKKPVEKQSTTAKADQREALKVLDISAQRYSGLPAIAVQLSAEVDADRKLDQWFAVFDAQEARVEGSWIVGDSAKVLYFTAVEPEQSYSVQVERGLPAKFAKISADSYSGEVTIAAVPEMLGFAGNGNLLAGELSDGLPVIAANVDRVDVDFFRIPERYLVSYLADNSRRGQQSYWNSEDYLADFELVYSGRFNLSLQPNQQGIRYLPIKGIKPLEQPGVFVAVMRKSGRYEYTKPVTWFAVSDLAVHLRQYPDSITANISSLASADPISEAKISLIDESGKLLLEGLSSEAGLWSSDDRQALDKAQLLIVTHRQGTSLVRLRSAALDLTEFPIEGPNNTSETLFFYSPRDLYRPGETVPISGLLRDADGRAKPVLYSPEGRWLDRKLEVSLHRPDGRAVAEKLLSPTELGYVSSQWVIDKSAPTGQWQLRAKLRDGSSASYDFQVEEFLPERMQLTLKAPTQQHLALPWQVVVQGEYLYGAAAAGNTAEAELSVQLGSHPFERWQEFYFADPTKTDSIRRESLEDIQLDSQGNGQFQLPADWSKAATALTAQLYVSLIDSGGRPVSRRVATQLLPAKQLVGIRPEFKQHEVDYDSNANFEVLLTDGEKLLASDRLVARLIREQRDYHWVHSEEEGWRSDYTVREYLVEQQSLAIVAGEKQSLSFAVEWGHYRLELVNPETGLVSGYRFRAGWSADETLMAGRPDRVGLALDKQAYQAGDAVTVDIKPPAAGKGWLLIESDTELWRQPIDIPATGGQVSFTLDKAWQRHDLYLSVLLVQPGEQREARLPRRMMGIAPLPLDRSSRQLSIELPGLVKAKPNSRLTVPIQVSGQAELPEQVMLTLAAVDVGVLNISRFSTPDPFAGFFAQRRYSVVVRDSYGDLINAGDGELASLEFGGDADFNDANQPAQDVEIVALFSGPVSVDKQGRVDVPLDLPDFNGRLRLMALAFGEQQFGSAERELTVASPVVTQLTRPRFLAPGDSARLALDVHNLSGETQQLNLALNLGQGLSLAEGGHTWKQQDLVLANDQRRLFSIEVVAADINGVQPIELNISGVAAEADLQRQWPLLIRPAWSEQQQVWQSRLEPGQSDSFDKALVAGWIAESTRGQLQLSSRPSIDFNSHFRALKAYPYGCLEQTTSGVFPQLYITPGLVEQFHLPQTSVDERQQAMRKAIMRLVGMQKRSGGYGLWSDDDSERYWLTAYVTDFLLRAQQAGYPVPTEALAKSQQRLGQYLRGNVRMRRGETSEFAIRAYAGLVLARQGAAGLGSLRTLYDRGRGIANGLGLLQLSLALEMAGDPVRASAAMISAIGKLNSEQDQWRNYGSPVRDLALSVFLLLESEKPSALWYPLLESLQQKVVQRSWLSTQERNALFLAGQALTSQGETQLAFTLDYQGKQQLEQDGFALPLDAQLLSESLAVRNTGAQDIYLNLRAQGRSSSAPKASSNGIWVERRYYDIDGQPLRGLSLESGDKVIVELLVSAEQRREQGLVVDLLPAGLELENQNLNDAYDIADLQIEGVALSELVDDEALVHQEFRADRYVAAVQIPRRDVVKLYYMARAVSAGDFVVPGTFAEDMYRPTLRHQGSSELRLQVAPRQ